jgi:hypothetical protein
VPVSLDPIQVCRGRIYGVQYDGMGPGLAPVIQLLQGVHCMKPVARSRALSSRPVTNYANNLASVPIRFRWAHRCVYVCHSLLCPSCDCHARLRCQIRV